MAWLNNPLRRDKAVFGSMMNWATNGKCWGKTNKLRSQKMVNRATKKCDTTTAEAPAIGRPWRFFLRTLQVARREAVLLTAWKGQGPTTLSAITFKCKLWLTGFWSKSAARRIFDLRNFQKFFSRPTDYWFARPRDFPIPLGIRISRGCASRKRLRSIDDN